MLKQFLITLLIITTPTIYSLQRRSPVSKTLLPKAAWEVALEKREAAEKSNPSLLDQRFVRTIEELQSKPGVAERIAAGSFTYESYAAYYMDRVKAVPVTAASSPLTRTSLQMLRGVDNYTTTPPVFTHIKRVKAEATDLDTELAKIASNPKAKSRIAALKRQKAKLGKEFKDAHNLITHLKELKATDPFLDYMVALEKTLRATASKKRD